MDYPFTYDKPVTGRNFIGRKEDCAAMGNLLGAKEHIVLYEPSKSGKKSLLLQTFFDMRMKGKQFVTAQFTLLDVRSLDEFLRRLGSVVIKALVDTPDEYAQTVSTYLEGTHFVFDPKVFSDNDEIVSLNWKTDENDLTAMLRLPFLLSRDKDRTLYLVIEEFQNIDFVEDSDKVLRTMERILNEMKEAGPAQCSLVFSGSMVNAMKEIFEVKRRFYRLVEHYALSRIAERDIIEHITKGFMTSGKVVEKELLLGVCRLFRGNLWYINHFIAICDSLSKGYIVEATLMEALGKIIAIHEPRFLTTMNNLTTFQLTLLRAILDGHNKFSTTEVIESYGLNSSANVKRLKDALLKKEIITLGEKDEPRVLDPLFEYWVRKYFFHID